MKFKLNHPFIFRLNQLQRIAGFRDGQHGIRSQDLSEPWNDFKSATINGILEQHHIYFIVSRSRARFAGLKSPSGQHFLYDPRTKRSPVEVNFETLSAEQGVIDGFFDLSSRPMADTLLDAFKDRLEINQLLGILGEPLERQYVTAASFVFPREEIKVVLSPDLWKFVYFPGNPLDSGLKLPTDFDYRIEYIGKSINSAEERLAAHEHVIRVQSDLSSQQPNREAFAVMYQLDFEKKAGVVGVGSRAEQLELEAAEAMLIQYFKPKYNIRSRDFSIAHKNADVFDENLANRMRVSGDFDVGQTSIELVSPAGFESELNLSWGRFFTDHHSSNLTRVNQFIC